MNTNITATTHMLNKPSLTKQHGLIFFKIIRLEITIKYFQPLKEYFLVPDGFVIKLFSSHSPVITYFRGDNFIYSKKKISNEFS